MHQNRRFRVWSALALLAAVSACSGTQPTAQIPVSGVNGNNGGAVATIYWDSQGHAHFEN